MRGSVSETFEEWKQSLSLRYTFGLTRTDGASRRYHDEKFNIGAECHTPRCEETEKWGKSEWVYYFEDSKKKHSSLDSLFEEAKTRSKKQKEGER